MIKSILVLFNLLGLFICRLFFPVSVNVSQTVPFSSSVNNSFIVQVAINKGDLKGIAKFTEQLPKGFSATPIDLQGAKTIFDNHTIQYSWDSLPADNILNISFRVDVGPASMSGKDTLIGKFFYINDNQKLESDCLPSYINISGPIETNTIGTRVIDSIKTCQGGVFGIRRLPSAAVPPNSEAKITIIIHKPGISGFAKVEDSLPPGFTAAAIDANGASFTFVDNIAKFVWQNIPGDSVIIITYRLMAGSQISGTHAISGNFSYIYNSAPLSCSLGTTIFNTTVLSSNNAPAANNARDTSTSGSPPRYLVFTPAGKVVTTKPDTIPVAAGNSNLSAATINPVNNSNPVNNPGSANSSAQVNTTNPVNNSGTANNSNPTIASIPGNNQSSSGNNSSVTPGISAQSQGGINYRVQIMALHHAVDVSYFSLKRNINTQINTEILGGFTKYTIGNYPDYKTVRDERENIRNRGIVGPFVVCYNSGTRITVQEALMISHQKWYQ